MLESENVCIRGQAVGRSSVLQESLRRSWPSSTSSPSCSWRT
ncbi:MAG: hypothetical protein ACLTYN_07235 [Dysosmobacter welbionis]